MLICRSSKIAVDGRIHMCMYVAVCLNATTYVYTQMCISICIYLHKYTSTSVYNI